MHVWSTCMVCSTGAPVPPAKLKHLWVLGCAASVGICGWARCGERFLDPTAGTVASLQLSLFSQFRLNLWLDYTLLDILWKKMIFKWAPMVKGIITALVEMAKLHWIGSQSDGQAGKHHEFVLPLFKSHLNGWPFPAHAQWLLEVNCTVCDEILPIFPLFPCIISPVPPSVVFLYRISDCKLFGAGHLSYVVLCSQCHADLVIIIILKFVNQLPISFIDDFE